MLSRVSLGRGNSPPARTSSTYHSGSSRHTVCTPLLYRWCAVFATIFDVFRPFSLFFVRFLYAGPRPSGGRGTRSRNTGTGGRAPARGGNADPGGPWPPPHRAGPPARSAAAESAGGSRADRGGGSPAQSDRRAASPAGAGRGRAHPPERVPPPRPRRDRLPRTPGAGGAAARGAARRR